MSLLQNRSKHQNRIQGWGSNGTEKKVWKCPAGHLLQPLKASAGTCDGCRVRVADGEQVMTCRACNYYLCEACHPQEREPRSWLWGSVSSVAEKLAQEFTDLQEVAELAETKGPLAACAAPPVRKGGPQDDTEITVIEEEEERSGGCQAAAAAPITPAAAAPRATDQAQAEHPTPPKVDAPKVELGVDLLGLDFDPKIKTSAPADTVSAVDPLDLL